MTIAWILAVCPLALGALVTPSMATLGLEEVQVRPKISGDHSSQIAKEAIAKAYRAVSARRSTHLSSTCPSCNGKSYSEPCPHLWTELEDGSCIPPLTYKGSCSTKQTFMGASALDKQEAEVVCEVCWPCPDEIGCERDWSRPCPYAYSASSIQFHEFAAKAPACTANEDYQGGCESSVHFSSDEEKQQFAQRCSVTWPCKTSCENSIEAICPKDWLHIGEWICAAPSYYKEADCEVLHSFHGWTPAMKTEYAKRCRVVWPCHWSILSEVGKLEIGPVNVMPKCGELNLQSCPTAWTASADGSCHPPRSSMGPCTESVQLGSLTTEQKLKWSGQCLLSWPCKDEIEDGTMVHAPWKISAPGEAPQSE